MLFKTPTIRRRFYLSFTHSIKEALSYEASQLQNLSFDKNLNRINCFHNVDDSPKIIDVL